MSEGPNGDEGRTRHTFVRPSAFIAGGVVAAVIVVAIILLRAGSPPPPSEKASPSTAPAAPRVPPSLRVASRTANRITLAWTMPSGGRKAVSFRILRDGNELTTLPASASTYEDDSLWPATRYRYRVQAVFDHGQAASKVITVRTVTPPVWRGRLEGDFSVTYTVSSSNLTNAHPGEPLGDYTWTFGPGCDRGPCGGHWTIQLHEGPDAKGHIRLKAQSYAGGMTSQPLGSCGSTTTLDSATLNLRITKSAPRFGEWRAVAFTGRFREYFPAANGCAAGFLDAAVTGAFKPE